MNLVLDTGPIVSLAVRSDPSRAAVIDVLRRERGSLILPAPVTTEVDYLLSSRWGERVRQAFLRDLAGRRFDVVCLSPGEYRAVSMLEEAYSDLAPGLVDLSCVVIAHRFRTKRILTFDQRHFRAMRPIEGGAFEILPRDR